MERDFSEILCEDEVLNESSQQENLEVSMKSSERSLQRDYFGKNRKETETTAKTPDTFQESSNSKDSSSIPKIQAMELQSSCMENRSTETNRNKIKNPESAFKKSDMSSYSREEPENQKATNVSSEDLATPSTSTDVRFGELEYQEAEDVIGKHVMFLDSGEGLSLKHDRRDAKMKAILNGNMVRPTMAAFSEVISLMRYSGVDINIFLKFLGAGSLGCEAFIKSEHNVGL